MAMFPALMQPIMRKITGDDSLCFLGHFGSSCYWLSGQIGKLCNKNNKGRTTEDVKFPKRIIFFSEIIWYRLLL